MNWYWRPRYKILAPEASQIVSQTYDFKEQEALFTL